jgi:hypothetical protein
MKALTLILFLQAVATSLLAQEAGASASHTVTIRVYRAAMIDLQKPLPGGITSAQPWLISHQTVSPPERQKAFTGQSPAFVEWPFIQGARCRLYTITEI